MEITEERIREIVREELAQHDQRLADAVMQKLAKSLRMSKPIAGERLGPTCNAEG